MEIHAYSELYLESAQNIIGHMFDFAVNEIGIPADEFAGIFEISSVCREVERGNPTYVAGKTGPELAKIVLENACYPAVIPGEVMYADRSPEYWAGWSGAYYQWLRNRSFHIIFKAVPFSRLLEMYPVYHEMDICRFVEEMDRLYNAFYPETALKRKRDISGLSQRELAELSGVPLRQIQLFEQRQRNISKTQAVTVQMLSKALGCTMEELL